MQLFAGGCRGSRVASDARFARYGADTTSYLIEGARGERIVVDAGTGIRNAEPRLDSGGPTPLLILFTHYHLDHVEGLPAFAPLYRAGRRIELAAPPLGGLTPAAVLPRLFDHPLWPVPLAALPAEPGLRTLDAAPLRHGGIEVRWTPVDHPGGCCAYRFDEPDGGALVIATDMEWELLAAPHRARFLDFCRRPRPPDWLLLDGQYTPENYAAHRGWGHSRWSECVEISRAARAAKLRVIHHAPGADDRVLDAADAAVRAALPAAALLRQGEVLGAEGTA
jgi:phosphoribosyl 1,2-cyclic phosphodiesterase